MKKKIITSFSVLFIAAGFVFTSGCSKDTINNFIHDSTTIVNHDTITNTFWTLQYSEGSSGNNTYYAPQSFIKSGTAKFASNLYHAGYWFSIFDLPLPKEIHLNIDNDSLKLVANVRNTNGDGTANEIDLGLIYNTSTSAQVMGTWQKGSNALYCLLGITGQVTNNISEQLTDPTNYAEYAINVKANQITSYKNNTSLKSVSYTGTTGALKALRIAFRGYGEIDWVKLYNGNKLIMSEDFNTDGTTTAVWTMP